ncbi:kinase-like domain-containing protein, partial [Hyaloraphidium curvatum]
DRNQRLGEGGFGVVYAGILRGSNAVAVKTIKGDLDEKTMLAFIKEVVNWEGLVQRNVLPLMAFCISPPMMITDLVEEGNMRKYLAGHNWDQAMGLRFLIEVTAGMSYLHGSGILHGDLKSLNVLIDGSRAVITDFGLSQLRSQVSKSTSKVGNGLQGTPGFVAPEILAGGRLQAPADVYAFAMTAYEVLSRGSYPFEDLTNVATIVYKVAVEQARPARPDGVADPVWTLVERCWAHDPAARPTFV